MSGIHEPETEELKTPEPTEKVETLVEITQPDEELDTVTQITTIQTYEAVVETIENNLENIQIKEEVTEQVNIEAAKNEPKADKILAIFNTEELSSESIGLAVLKKLIKEINGYVCVAGNSSLNKIVTELNNSDVEFYELDTKSKESINKFAMHIKETYGGVNILINNYNLSDASSTASEIVKLNYNAITNLFNELFPLLRAHARIVNISSRRGLLRKCTDRRLRNRISNIEKLEDLNSLVVDYIKSVEENTIDDTGFPDSPFEMSKLLINVLTKIQQKNFDDSNSDLPGMIANSICPGETETKVVELALLPNDYSGLKGCFYIENDQVDWETGYLLIQNF